MHPIAVPRRYGDQETDKSLDRPNAQKSTARLMQPHVTARGGADRDDAQEAEMSAAIARCADGDRLALRLIFDREAGRMVGVAMRILRRQELAEEAVQESFMRIWRGARGFDPSRGAARTWLYTIVRNQALTKARGESRFAADELTDAHQAVPDDAIARLPEQSALRRCLGVLENERRTAVVLSYVEGLSHAQIAARLNVPLGTAKSWTRRGLQALRECMG